MDTPSAIAFSDSAILASFMDAVLLVMRAQEAPRGGEKQVRDMLARARANVVGVVLNGVKPQLVDSYHYHAAYYPQIAKETVLPALPAPAQELPAPMALKDGYEQTLMGVTLDHSGQRIAPALLETHGAQVQSIEETTVADTLNAEPARRSGFNLRSLFGTEDKK